MTSVVAMTAPGEVRLIEEPEGALAASEVRVRTLFSGISAGTELSTYRGTSPHVTKHWDPASRLFVDGMGGIAYPVTSLGYEEVGEITELGSDAAGLQLGERLWGTWGHRTTAVLDAGVAASRTLPPDADPRIGMFSHIGAVALNAILDADIHVGETVVVSGLGVPGQLVAQLARLNGATVIVVDGIAERRRLAVELGADVALDPADGPSAERVRELTGGLGADVAIEVSGNHHALQEAIRSVAYNSRVCAVGFYQGDGVGLRLGEEFHHNRVQLVSSQIGGSAPSVSHRWDRRRLNTTLLDLAFAGRLDVLSMISHEVAYTEAADAYRMLDANPRDILQLVLDFGGGS